LVDGGPDNEECDSLAVVTDGAIYSAVFDCLINRYLPDCGCTGE